ncbi:MAG: GntR family transcriptional regulator [Planctomycetia bacterium]|nr:GntR family transcriptional regulator [Planctomycetia bacterium]
MKKQQEKVYDAIHRKLLTRELNPGMKISERKMAAELGVSRTPLREAVQILQQEGVLERQEDGTILVKQSSEEEILEVYEVRLILEPFCTQQAARRATTEGCLFLQECCRKETALITQMESGEISQEDFACCRYLIMMEVEAPFHQKISEMAGNQLVAKMMNQLRLLSRSWVMIPSWERTLAEDVANRRRVASEHEQIFQAIEARDEAVAYEAARFHVQNALDIILNQIKTRQKPVETMEQKLSRLRQSLR